MNYIKKRVNIRKRLKNTWKKLTVSAKMARKYLSGFCSANFFHKTFFQQPSPPPVAGRRGLWVPSAVTEPKSMGYQKSKPQTVWKFQGMGGNSQIKIDIKKISGSEVRWWFARKRSLWGDSWMEHLGFKVEKHSWISCSGNISWHGGYVLEVEPN